MKRSGHMPVCACFLVRLWARVERILWRYSRLERVRRMINFKYNLAYILKINDTNIMQT